MIWLLYFIVSWFILGVIGSMMYCLIINYLLDKPKPDIIQKFVLLGFLSIIICFWYIFYGGIREQREENRKSSLNFTPFFKFLTFPRKFKRVKKTGSFL